MAEGTRNISAEWTLMYVFACSFNKCLQNSCCYESEQPILPRVSIHFTNCFSIPRGPSSKSSPHHGHCLR